MNKKLTIALFATIMAVFTFSSLPAYACKGNPKCPHHTGKKMEEKMEKKCKKDCSKPCCKKANLEKKCTKHKNKKPNLDHNDNSRYND